VDDLGAWRDRRRERRPGSGHRPTHDKSAGPREQPSVAGAAGIGFTLPSDTAPASAPGPSSTLDIPFVGGERRCPGDLDLFFYKGKSAITARAGASPTQLTAQLGLGYRAPWDLFGDQPRASRYMIGVGLVATVTQSRLDPHDWSATVGLELEPLGALRYLLGIKSWY
jgi:hypothetical protein